VYERNEPQSPCALYSNEMLDASQLECMSSICCVDEPHRIIAEVFPLARAREAFEYGAGTHSPGHQRFTVARLLLAEDTPERVKCE
jgi:hypothetical protein